ncbi:hypothetical protein STA1M1_26470 [Sinisalibacter aestuarii]|uniref:Cation transport ATPase n=2 Tax=Sinisalibacter aestuarii TaxID=2949426 RepID=A0ABQ5LUW8_9RHOB|nr:hypothetical protein STA1M1_26470 [Sinisalibacter aestuarii]
MAIGRWLGLALAGAVLSGCMNGGGPFGGGTGGTDAHAPASVQVMAKSFTIAGPRGFCIDPGGTRDSAESAFAMLGSCAVISGNPRDAKPKAPAILTASVTPLSDPLDDATLDRMTAYLATDDGRAALARADGVGEVTVVDLGREDGLVLVHARDGTSTGDMAGDYWRAVFATADKLVTLTVSGFRTAPLSDDAGADLTRAFVAAIRRANPASAPPAATVPETGGGGRLASFFNRLL